jgi:hypothetical protein
MFLLAAANNIADPTFKLFPIRILLAIDNNMLIPWTIIVVKNSSLETLAYEITKRKS